MSRLIGYLIVGGLAAASPLAGQDFARLAHQVDSTYRVAMQLRAELQAHRKANPPAAAWDDTLAIARGKVTLYFNDEMADVTRAGAALADAELAELGAAVDRLKPIIFSIVPDTAASAYDARIGRFGEVSMRRFVPADPAHPNRTSTDRTPRSIASVIILAVTSNAGLREGAEVAAWNSSNIPLAPSLAPPTDWGAVRLFVVSSPSPLGRSCFLGDGRACRRFLGIDTVADPARELFDTTGRRLLVEYEGDRATRASAIATSRCRSGNDDACLAVLDIIGVSPLAPPFVRTSIVTRALQLGGSMAAERLMTSTGSPSEAMSAAARVPFDSVVADWQRHLGRRSGTAGTLPLGVALSSLVWIAACTLLALRSPRWR